MWESLQQNNTAKNVDLKEGKEQKERREPIPNPRELLNIKDRILEMFLYVFKYESENA